MPGRLDPRPLIGGVRTGLRLRRNSGPEPADHDTRAALLGVPSIVFMLVLVLNPPSPPIDPLLASIALIIGGLLASFSQLAAWRERVLSRNQGSAGRRTKALDEATAHILVSVMVSILGCVVLLLASGVDTPQAAGWLHGAGRVLTAIGAAAFSYLGLTLYVVVNLLWDAYNEDTTPPPPE